MQVNSLLKLLGVQTATELNFSLHVANIYRTATTVGLHSWGLESS